LSREVTMKRTTKTREKKAEEPIGKAEEGFGTTEKVVPLTQAAYNAWNSAALRAMHTTLFDWGSIKLRAQSLGRPLEVADLEELFHKDAAAPADTKCAVCGEKVEPYVALVIDQNDGSIVLDKRTNTPLERGIFVAKKQKDGSLATEAGCPKHLGFLRIIEVRGERKRVPAQSFAQAQAQAEAINSTFRKEQSLFKQYEEEHAFNRNRNRGTGGQGMSLGDPRVGTEPGGGRPDRRRGEHKRRHANSLPGWDGKGM
jgi:hypothetical protein